ncbi:MAG: methyltransferase domain-containing protein [Chloroflexi bacterium]|jgi:ubiquinone/menaquinone biosynthesis C-methylase UbiE|nr:methyltransferase domain-containing protein [Chloroflexota bacterium]
MSQQLVAEQYKTSDNLDARAQLHARFSRSTIPWHRWIFDHIDPHILAHGRVLALGCGPGGLWQQNRDRVPADARLVLTDFSPGMMASARTQLVDLPCAPLFAVVDAQAIPFVSTHFDAVTAHHMLYHVPDRAKALREIRRVLAPRGTFYASTVGEDHMREMWELVEPFAPGAIASARQVTQGFTLENGAAQLAPLFDEVQVHRYEDSLIVPEAAPLIAYVRSSLTMLAHSALTAESLAAFSEEVERRIATDGPLRITKASGLFIAR